MATVGGFKTDDWQRLGRTIASRRAMLNLTQEQAAEEAGIGPTTWGEIERGHRENVRNLTLAAIASVLEWPPEEPKNVLLGGRPDQRGPFADELVLEGRLAKVEERLERLEKTHLDNPVTQLVEHLAQAQDELRKLRRRRRGR